ncbi:hypothetical protein GCM10010401_11580 [Rarobacter faecitabidus]|uniref:Uncharacterized protein n=1 Tax=Rarobacter faecitabidus TaxID=13243 RepID=A0A542ZP04_RARFA|nr:hypothetical protein [Rarobacter faecitabidus]TQL62104.1 hypothetical protein FB461_1740 [Rarobacter faecitabidus]
MAKRVEHLLAIPTAVRREELVLLADARFGGAHVQPGPGPWALSLSRYATLTEAEPGALDLAQATAVGLLMDEPFAARLSSGFPLRVLIAATLRERAERPDFPLADRHGVLHLFGETVPDRQERRTLDWLIAAAARLHGAVIVDSGSREAERSYAAAIPDPRAAMNLTVYSPTWLTPRAGEHVCGQVVPGSALLDGERAWPGPSPDAVIVPGRQLSVDERVDLHAIVDAHDIAALQGDDSLAGYAVASGLATGGLIVVEAGPVEVLPVALRSRADLIHGCVQYRIAWEPDDPGLVHGGHLTAELAVEQEVAARTIAALAEAISEVAGGYVLDDDGFPRGRVVKL